MLSTLQPPSRFLSHFHTKLSHAVTLSSLTAQSNPKSSPSATPSSPASHIAQTYLNRLRLTEPHINSFLYLSDTVLQQANSIDDRIARNEEVRPLVGVLIGVKDNICTEGMPSTGGSRVLEGIVHRSMPRPLGRSKNWEDQFG